MVNEKHMFVAAAVLVVAFMGFLALSGNIGGRNSAGAAQATGAGCGYSGCGGGSPAGSGAAPAASGGEQAQAPVQVQEVEVRALASGGYDNPTVNVKAGVPVKFDFSADPGAGCGRQIIIDNVGVNLVSRNGETESATFTPQTPGQYRFHCGMNMFRGVLVAS